MQRDSIDKIAKTPEDRMLLIEPHAAAGGQEELLLGNAARRNIMRHKASQTGDYDAIVGQQKAFYVSGKFNHGAKVFLYFRFQNAQAAFFLSIL